MVDRIKRRWRTRTTLLVVLIISSLTSFAQTTFYSRATGNWTSTTTWSTTSCSGGAATSVPGAGDNVIICSGKTVTFNSGSNVTIADLTVQSASTLTISSSSYILLGSLVLDGTVDGNSPGDLRMGNVAGSTLSGGGFFSTNNVNSLLRLQSAVTILAGTDLKFDDDGRLGMNGSIATNYGKVSILDPSNFSGNGTFVNAASTSYLLYSVLGNFPKRTTLTATAVGNTVEFGAISGNRNMDRQSSYYNLVITGGGTKRIPVTTTTIAGNLTINNGATLNAYTKSNTATAINIYGNWVNNLGGAFTELLSTVSFKGTANDQTIYPPAGGETFYNLTINNTNASGTVTANGAIYITDSKTLTVANGIFNMGTNTLTQASGNANFTATGGELRLAKLSTTLPELTGTYNVTGGTISFTGAGAQTIKSLDTSPSSYYHVALSGSGAKTLSGNITVRGNWTNSGVSLAGNYTVTFGGTGTQNISRASTETFYSLTTNTTGPLTLSAGNVTVTSLLTMTKGNINLNGFKLLLNSSGTTLSRTLGICYGGTFSRYFPASTAINSSATPYYGLFPVGTSNSYRPVTINSTANATTGGTVSVVHNDATTTTDVSYNDNEAMAIQRITDMNSAISTSLLVGGTYTLGVTMTSLSSTGTLSDLKLETLSAPLYSVGTTVATTGTLANPTVTRSGLTQGNLNNNFVVGTKAKSTTPLVASYYSRKTGNWSDNSANSTWSTTDGGPSCGCTPSASSRVYINTAYTVTLDVAGAADFLTIRTGGTLTGTNNMTVAYDLLTVGTGKFTPSGGAWIIGRKATIAGTSSSTSAASFTVNGDLEIDASNSLALTGGATVTGDLQVDGTLAIGTGALTLTGTNATISGSGGASAITGTGTITFTNAKTIASGSTLNIQPTIALSVATTVTNQGTINHLADLNGSNTTSIWINDSNSALNTTGAILAVGVLNTAAVPNLVNYNGSTAQTVKVPTGGSYYNLKIANAGTKPLAGNTSVVNSLTIQDAAALNAGTNTLDGAGDLLMSGTSGFTIAKSSNGTYPELTGSYDLNGGTITMGPAGANYDIREVSFYNLVLTATGNSNMDFNAGAEIQNNLTATLFNTARIRNIDSDLIIGNVFTFNSSSTNASTLTNNVSADSFTLTAGSVSLGAYIFELTGANGWTRNGGTYTQDANGTVLLSGDVDQVIGGSTATSFTNVEINNGGPTGVTLNKNATVTGILTLTEGNLVTSASNFLTMSTTSSVSGVSDDSYVEGPMEKDVNSTTANAFNFPVGKDDVYRPISVSSVSAVGTFRAEYFHLNPNGSYNVTLKDVALNHIGQGEYWILNQASGTPGAVVTLSWDDYSGVVDIPTELRVARWNGSLWKDHGNGGTTSTPPTVKSSAVITSFSPFTIASATPNNPLPVELVSFTAQLINNIVELKWTTLSEKNNDFFTIDKTKNTESFTLVGRVHGAGTSILPKTYSTTDTHPYAGNSYYRLAQTDLDGETTHFGLVAVYNDGSELIRTVTAFPNPVSDEVLNVTVSGFDVAEEVTLEFRDALGVLMVKATGTTDSSGVYTYLLNTNQLAKGIYLLHVRSMPMNESLKIVVR